MKAPLLVLLNKLKAFPLNSMKACGSGGKGPLIRNLGKRWMWSVTFTNRPFIPGEIFSGNGPGGWIGQRTSKDGFKKKKYFGPTLNWTTIPWSSSPYTSYHTIYVDHVRAKNLEVQISKSYKTTDKSFSLLYSDLRCFVKQLLDRPMLIMFSNMTGDVRIT
jgi:hypothetical protein